VWRLTALLTGADSGLLTAVVAFDSRLVEAGGTLANLAAGLILWLALGGARAASMPTRYFLLNSCTFNFFQELGIFLFRGDGTMPPFELLVSAWCAMWEFLSSGPGGFQA